MVDSAAMKTKQVSIRIPEDAWTRAEALANAMTQALGGTLTIDTTAALRACLLSGLDMLEQKHGVTAPKRKK